MCGDMGSIIVESDGLCEDCWKPTWVDVNCGYCGEPVAVIENHNKWRTDTDYLMCIPCFNDRKECDDREDREDRDDSDTSDTSDKPM